MAWLTGYTYRKKITATGTPDGDWVSPTGFVDPDTEWNNETNAYDENTGTAADSLTAGEDEWTKYLELTHVSLYCDKVRFYADYLATGINQISVDVYYSSAWHNIYEGVFANQTWVEKAIGSTQQVIAARVKFYNDSRDGANLWEFDFNEVRTLTNYQLALDVNYGAGSDSGLSVFCNSLCDTDFDDIRFTKSDGDTQIDYWLEEKTNSDDATFWVEFHSILPTATNYFYMYYGKTGDSTTSNGANTFIVFDDFERGNNGDAIGGDWTIEQGDIDISTGQHWGGTRSAKFIGHATHPYGYIGVTASDRIAIRCRLYKENLAQAFTYHGDGTYFLNVLYQADENIRYRDDGGYHDTGTNITADQWELVEFNDFAWATPTFDIWHNGAEIQANAVPRTGAELVNLFRWLGSTTSGADFWIDDFLVRNWTTNEPTLAWSTREAKFIFTSSVIIGNKVTASKSWNVTTSASVLIGVKVTASKIWGIVKSASVLVGNKVAASRAMKYTRKAAVLIGNKVTATKTWGIVKSASVLVGNKVTASKTWGIVKSASVLIGVLVTASKIWGIVKSSSVIIGNKVTASRTLAYARSASVLIGNKVSASKTWGIVKSASVLIGNKVSASRVVAYARSATVIIGVKVSAVVSIAYAAFRALVIIGNKVTASKTWGPVKSASVIIGEKVTASRVLSYVRSSTVTIGVKVTASVEFFIQTVIELTVYLYDRSATVYLNSRSLSAYLYNRALTLKLNSRALILKLYNRALSLYARIK